MAKSMVHWNGNQLCAMDVETTGLDPLFNEIIQLAIIPLTSDIEPRPDVAPLVMYIKPNHPDRVKPEALKVNKISMIELMTKGFDSETAISLLEDWIKKLKLPCTESGRQKRIIPLGQNYMGFDKMFIQQWMGIDLYEEYFDYHCVDTMVAANYLNDRAAFHAETVPFPKVNLQYLATTLKIETDRAHDALSDALTASKVYKAMLKLGPLLL